MRASVTCPGCDKRFKAPHAVLGKSVRCPTCAARFVARAVPAHPATASPGTDAIEADADQARGSGPVSSRSGRVPTARPRTPGASGRRRRRPEAPHRMRIGITLVVLVAFALTGLGTLAFWWQRARVPVTQVPAPVARLLPTEPASTPIPDRPAEPRPALPAPDNTSRLPDQQPAAPRSAPPLIPDRPAEPPPSPAPVEKANTPGTPGGSPTTAAATLADEMGRAIAGVTLAPVNISIGGVDFTLDVPQGAQVSQGSKSAALKRGSQFELKVDVGRVDLSSAKRRWQTDEAGQHRSVLLETEDTLFGSSHASATSPEKDFHRFVWNVALGHLDLHFESGTYTDSLQPFSRRDCLVMLHCARTVKLKKASPPRSLQDMQRLGAVVERDESGKVTSLALAGMPCSDATLAVLALDKLAPRLEELDLSGAAVSDRGLKHLARLTNLRVLILPENALAPIEGSGLAHLKALRRLDELSLANTATTDKGLANLNGLASLRSLDLHGTRVTGSEFEPFRSFTGLKALDLDETPFTDAGMRQLQTLVGLQELYLEGTKVTDAGLEYLKRLRKLTELELGGTQVTGTGLAHLGGLTELTSLGLSQSQFSDVGLKHLAGLRSLTSLDLTGTPVTGNGFRHLRGLARLKELSLSESPVDDTGLAQFPALPALEALDLGRTKVTDAGLKPLHGLVSLTSLSLEDTQVSGSGLAALKHCRALGSLRLRHTPVTDSGLVHLQGCAHLTNLDLDGTPVTDTGLAYLKGLTELDSLGLSGTRVSDAGLEQLTRLVNLKTLRVNQTEVTTAGSAKLKKALPQVLIESGAGAVAP